MRLPLIFTAFILGLYSGSPLNTTPLPLSLAGTLLIVLLCLIAGRRTLNFITVTCMVVFTMVGWWWMSELPTWPSPLAEDNNTVTILGRVESEPFTTRHDRYIPIDLRMLALPDPDSSPQTDKEWVSERGTVLLEVPKSFRTTPGTTVIIDGNLNIDPDILHGPIVSRYRPRGIITATEIDTLPASQQTPSSSSILHNLKYHLISHLAWGISKPEDELVAGITFGRKGRRLDGNWSRNFYSSGLSHLIVASGAQVSILFLPLFFLLGRSGLSRKFQWIILAGLGISLMGFAQLLGGEPSILRAAIMGCVLLLAIGLGRRTSGLATLSAAGFFWLIINPLLVHDVSFLLSFAASFGIIYLTPLMFKINLGKSRQRSWEGKSPICWRSIWKSISNIFRAGRNFVIDIGLITIAAQIGVFPALACTIGRISLSGLLANLIAVPIAQIILYLGALSAAGGFISPVIPMVVNPILEHLAGMLISIADFFSRIPFANTQIQPLPGWFAFVWYLFLFIIVESINVRREPVKVGGERSDTLKPTHQVVFTNNT